MKKVTKKIKAVKPRSQVDCKAFKAQIAAAALPQSAWYSVITQVPAHALLLPASRSFKADNPPNVRSVRLPAPTHRTPPMPPHSVAVCSGMHYRGSVRIQR
ncbi:hypothetical protein [Parapedobacter indicus]|uniref:hypothetical protein n=1 Tax=Parapedobacter indicus TaxID=1477437 RepID=UPI000B88793F|nr:hypothetical protein [Parapedobacter indicus]